MYSGLWRCEFMQSAWYRLRASNIVYSGWAAYTSQKRGTLRSNQFHQTSLTLSRPLVGNSDRWVLDGYGSH
jgi:hypothetical protein